MLGRGDPQGAAKVGAPGAALEALEAVHEERGEGLVHHQTLVPRRPQLPWGRGPCGDGGGGDSNVALFFALLSLFGVGEVCNGLGQGAVAIGYDEATQNWGCSLPEYRFA